MTPLTTSQIYASLFGASLTAFIVVSIYGIATINYISKVLN